MTPHVYVAVFSSEKIDANEDAAIILNDISEHARNEFRWTDLSFSSLKIEKWGAGGV